jgi:hypothetical protein
MNRDSLTVEQIEQGLSLAGKRTADVPELAGFRRKFRRRFYLITDANFFLLLWNVLASIAPSNRLWPITLAAAVVNLWTIHFCEQRARLMSRQLHRRAAEQLWLDMNGRFDD